MEERIRGKLSSKYWLILTFDYKKNSDELLSDVPY
jgi:hypothetical protein